MVSRLLMVSDQKTSVNNNVTLCSILACLVCGIMEIIQYGSRDVALTSKSDSTFTHKPLWSFRSYLLFHATIECESRDCHPEPNEWFGEAHGILRTI